MIFTVPIKVTTTGGAGVATGATTSDGPVNGYVVGAYFNFHASAPATQDTTLRTKGNSAPSYNLLVVTDSVTDVFKAVATPVVDAANAAVVNSHRAWPVADHLEISVAQSNALTDAVVVHVLIDDGR